MNEFFDHIYCYNLEGQSDRLESCLSQFKRFNLEVEMVKATDKRGCEWLNGVAPAHQGINDTVSNILEDAIKNNYRKILILQDDVIFRNIGQFNTIGLPDDWNFFSLGCMSLNPPSRISGNIFRSNCAILDHAIGINLKDGLLIQKYICDLRKYEAESDIIIAKMLEDEKIKYYMLRPHIATQGRFLSSYTNRIENAKECD